MMNIKHCQYTEIQKVEKLGKYLRLDGLYFKRDDLFGISPGGNKARKIQVIMEDVKFKRSDSIVTIGALQSNHARCVAAYSAYEGLDCYLVLYETEGIPSSYFTNGNIFLEKLYGSNIIICSLYENPFEVAKAIMREQKQIQKSPYFIPEGSNNLLGVEAYRRCMEEIQSQSKTSGVTFSNIILACGTGSTQAGLIVGQREWEHEIQIYGMNISGNANVKIESINNLTLEATTNSIELNPALCHSAKVVDPTNNQLSTEKIFKTLKFVASTEGILLDPIYTAKAMHIFINDLKKSPKKYLGNTLFLHTGGIPALYCYAEIFNLYPKFNSLVKN